MLLLLSSLFIQELMREQPNDLAKSWIEFSILFSISVLIVYNVVYVTYTVCINRKEKKRLAKLTK